MTSCIALSKLLGLIEYILPLAISGITVCECPLVVCMILDDKTTCGLAFHLLAIFGLTLLGFPPLASMVRSFLCDRLQSTEGKVGPAYT